MAYIPKPLHHESYKYGARPMSGIGGPTTIVIAALRENKCPIGFAPWPEEPNEPDDAKPAKKRKKGKR
jgi:hypothetical protein